MAAAAFEADGVLGRMIRLPFGEFPGAAVRSMAALDQFAHGWDLARAIGYPGDLDPELATELLASARLAITDGFRGPDGQAPFGPVAPAPAGAGPADQSAHAGPTELVAVAVVAGDGDPLLPCGRCRQLLLEAGGGSLLVDTADGPVELKVLLPAAFTTTDLAERRERETK